MLTAAEAEDSGREGGRGSGGKGGMARGRGVGGEESLELHYSCTTLLLNRFTAIDNEFQDSGK